MSWKRKEQASLAYIHHEDFTIKREANNAARKLRKEGWRTKVTVKVIGFGIGIHQLWKAKTNGL